MGLQQEIENGYLDADGLVAPHRVDPAFANASGNGILYTSEYIVLLKRLGELTPELVFKYQELMHRCQIMPGLLKRSPSDGGEHDSPDDYLGMAAGASACAPDLAQEVLSYGWQHAGMFNNPNAQKSSGAFMPRQLQLVAAYYWAAGKNPAFPLVLFAATLIASAGLNAPTSDTDNRILTWLLIEIAEPRSWLVRQSAKVWRKRLLKQYPQGMKDVFKIYFGADHPFTKYVPVA